MDKVTKIPETSDTPRSILVVDDDERVLLFIGRMLNAIGQTHLFTASSASEAHDIWRANSRKIWLLITDFVMPDENGDTLALQLLDQDSSLSVIFISGNDPFSLNSGIPLVSGKNFLQKPFTMAEMREIIRSTLAARTGKIGSRAESARPIVSFPAHT